MRLNRPGILLFVSAALFAAWTGCGRVPPVPESGTVGAEFPRLVSPVGISPPRAIPFETITLEAAQRMNGSRMTITFTRGKPAYTLVVAGQVYTVTGPADRVGDDIERTVVLIGDWLADSVELPQAVRGALYVVNHAAALANGQWIPAWSEIRFEQEWNRESSIPPP